MHRQFRADASPFVHQRRHQYLPSLIFRSEEVCFRHPHILEEHFIKLRVTSDLDQRTYGHSGSFHINDETTDATMFWRIRVRAHEQLDKFGTVVITGPDLLAVDNKIIA